MLKKEYCSSEPGFVLSRRGDSSERIQKRYVRIKEAVELFSFGQTKLREVARDAGAVRVIGRVTLYDVDKLNAYIDSFEE